MSAADPAQNESPRRFVNSAFRLKASERLAASTVGDFGPVALRSDPLTGSVGPMSPTIETARMLLRHAPPGAIFASELFATHAVLAEDHQVDAEYIGIIGDLDVETYCLYFNR